VHLAKGSKRNRRLDQTGRWVEIETFAPPPLEMHHLAVCSREPLVATIVGAPIRLPPTAGLPGPARGVIRILDARPAPPACPAIRAIVRVRLPLPVAAASNSRGPLLPAGTGSRTSER